MTKSLLLILVLLPSFLVAQPFKEVEDLAKAYITALKRTETSAFEKLYAPDSTKLSENMNTRLGFVYQDSLLIDFTSTVREGIKKGIDWSKVRYVKVEYITRRDGPFLTAHPCVIYFQHRLFRYAIHMNASKIEGSWGFVPYLDQDDRIEMMKI